ncbi:glycosyltransferase family 87 protein [Streptomyces sp. NPDC006733]|uniref:glycosyltransferase family 87 protein n=1 Tax=Streptomyces sp. NPDC006733 TaxID=3155460 RepID=UPI0033DEB64C
MVSTGTVPGRRLLWPAGVWLLTRLVLVSAALRLGPFSSEDGPDVSVSKVYRGWYDVLASGTFPHDDVSWQYPPGAALPILAPRLVPFLDYSHAFIVLCAVCDAVVLAALAHAARHADGRRSVAGPWMWVVGLPLLSTVPWSRFDVMVTAVAVGALLAAGSRRVWADRVFGVLVGLGAVVKVWPVLLLAGTARGRRTRLSWAAAALSAVLVTVGFLLAMPGALSFLAYQGDRGIEVESLGALPFHLARHFGWSGHWAPHDGSMEFIGPYVGLVARVSAALTVVAFGWLLLWRVRSGAGRTEAWALPDAALTAVLLFVVTSRVISPQYMVWLVGLAAVCLLHRATTQRPVAWLVLGACVLTTAVFPYLFRDLLGGSVPAALLLAARDLILLVAAVMSGVRLWRGTVPGATGGAPGTAGLSGP